MIYNLDDANCCEVVKDLHCHLISFGIQNQQALWKATAIHLQPSGHYSFTAQKGNEQINIQLNVVGYHNIYNALATIATADAYHLDLSKVKEALEEFTGASRRFEYRGMLNEAAVYDDYAHHPTEIEATIQSALALPHRKIWVIFQPHTYTRTKALFAGFSKAFQKADHVILTDIYAAREVDTGMVSSAQLAEAIEQTSHNCEFLATFKEIIQKVKKEVQKGDIVLTIGAGNITQLSHMLVETKSQEK